MFTTSRQVRVPGTAAPFLNYVVCLAVVRAVQNLAVCLNKVGPVHSCWGTREGGRGWGSGRAAGQVRGEHSSTGSQSAFRFFDAHTVRGHCTDAGKRLDQLQNWIHVSLSDWLAAWSVNRLGRMHALLCRDVQRCAILCSKHAGRAQHVALRHVGTGTFHLCSLIIPGRQPPVGDSFACCSSGMLLSVVVYSAGKLARLSLTRPCS